MLSTQQVALTHSRQAASISSYIQRNTLLRWDDLLGLIKSTFFDAIKARNYWPTCTIITRVQAKRFLERTSPTTLCIWWQTLIKESQPTSDVFFRFFSSSRILAEVAFLAGAAISDLPLFARRPRRIFPTSLTDDVTSQIAEDDWERGWVKTLVTASILQLFMMLGCTCPQILNQQSKVRTVLHDEYPKITWCALTPSDRIPVNQTY